MTDLSRGLPWAMRWAGAVAATALFFVFIPFSWMRIIHAWLGMGDLVETPIAQYLTRCLSAFYGFYGIMLVYMSFDVVRYLPLIRLGGACAITAGIFLLGLDVYIGMPCFWILGEGPFDTAFGAILFFAAGSVRRSAFSPCYLKSPPPVAPSR